MKSPVPRWSSFSSVYVCGNLGYREMQGELEEGTFVESEKNMLCHS